MKRVIATALVVVAAVTGVSVAEAAIRQGTFAGTTTAKDPVGFKVNSSGRVISFYYDGVTTKCSDGDTFPTPSGKFRVQTPTNHKFRVSSSGHFGITASNPRTGFSWTAKGGFKSSGAAATGTLRVKARFNDENVQDPKGNITCDSGTLKWSVKRK